MRSSPHAIPVEADCRLGDTLPVGRFGLGAWVWTGFICVTRSGIAGTCASFRVILSLRRTSPADVQLSRQRVRSFASSLENNRLRMEIVRSSGLNYANAFSSSLVSRRRMNPQDDNGESQRVLSDSANPCVSNQQSLSPPVLSPPCSGRYCSPVRT